MKDGNMIRNKEVHKVWHKFSNWLINKYGQDLHSEYQEIVIGNKKIKYRCFNDYELSKRLVGYEVMEAINKYIKRSCPEIKSVHCDDAVHAGSEIFLIPHPKMGITILYVPQCTSIQNQFFLYSNHCNQLIEKLKEMQWVYKNDI